MDEVMYREIHRLEEKNWWFVGMRRIAATLLAKGGRRYERALDLGCGSGGNLPLLHGVAAEVVACDLALPALRTVADEKAKRVAANGLALPFKDGAFDLVNLFNVIEHIDDDAAALAEAKRVLRPGGTLLLATSAFRALWSDHDEMNHHFRRYEEGELRGLLLRTGLAIDRLTYANAALLGPTFVVAAARRTAKKLGLLKPYEKNLVDVPPLANAALTRLLDAEAALLSRADLPAGVSIFAVARRG